MSSDEPITGERKTRIVDQVNVGYLRLKVTGSKVSIEGWKEDTRDINLPAIKTKGQLDQFRALIEGAN